MSFAKLSLLDFAGSPEWWRQAVHLAVAVWRYFVLPGIFMAFANVSTFWGLNYIQQGLTLSESSLDKILQASTVGAGWAIVGLIATMISLTMWLRRLTAFSHLLVNRAQPATTGAAIPEPAMAKSEFQRSLTVIKGRTGILLRVWFLASLYLMVPAIPFSILLSLQIINSPELSKQGMNLLSMPPLMGFAVNLALAAVTVVMAAYSILVLVKSSSANPRASEAATGSITLLWHNLVPVLMLTAVVLLANCLISTPREFLQMISGNFSISAPAPVEIAGQIWLGLSSIFLWPLSLVPYCILIKRIE